MEKKQVFPRKESYFVFLNKIDSVKPCFIIHHAQKEKVRYFHYDFNFHNLIEYNLT